MSQELQQTYYKICAKLENDCERVIAAGSQRPDLHSAQQLTEYLEQVLAFAEEG